MREDDRLSGRPLPPVLRKGAGLMLAAGVLVLVSAETAWATPEWVTRLRADRPLLAKVLEQVLDPWFFFGMTAQFVFFMRFVVQWIASEKKRRSTVPVAFWYLSLVGSLALFVYALHRWDFVIMAGQLLACVIYVRNLMLISDWRKRRRQAGLPTNDLDAEDADDASKPRSTGQTVSSGNVRH